MGFVELIGVGSISPFISVVSNPEIIHTNKYLISLYEYFNFSSDTNFIIVFGIAIICCLAFSNMCLAGVSFIIHIFSAKRDHSISMRLFEKYLRQPYIFYLNINTSELSKNILSEVYLYVNRVLIILLQLLSSAIISLFIVVLLIIVNPLLAVLTSITFAIIYIIVFSIVRKILAKKGKERFLQNQLKYKYINEAFGGIKDIKVLGKETVFLNFFSGPSKKLSMADAMNDVVNEIPKYLLETIAFSGILCIIIFMIRSGMKIEDFLPVLTVYAVGAYRLLPSLQKIFRAIASIRFHFQVVLNLHKDFTTLPEGESLATSKINKISFNDSIDLKNIVFRYPNTHTDTIKNQSISIKSNSSIAFVGSTGCGKTTFADIMLGLLEPQSGNIFVDGVEITTANRRGWQQNLGYVPQSIYLLDDSIEKNIAFGIDPLNIDKEAIVKAAKLANIHNFVISDLENGYDTIVGERGIRLSGGQRQRIGIARAVYHDPSVLILDEATSALDGLTENVIMDAIKNISHKKTIIIIAHRITTVKQCDVIYFMDKGEIVDYGSYDELYQKNNVFKKMADGY